MDNTFKEKYESVFARVCVFLGSGWRIDRRESDDNYRITLMNPALKNYTITARMEKDRIHLVGGVRRSRRVISCSSCSVAVSRLPHDIAREIKRKILVDAEKQIAECELDIATEARTKEEREQVINLVSRLVETRSYNGYYGVMCCFKSQGITGDVAEGYQNTYKLKLHDLSKDQLIKVVGFLSTLER